MLNEKSLKSDILKALLIGILAIIIKSIPFDLIFSIENGEGSVLKSIYYIPVILIYGAIAIQFASIKSNLTIGKKGAFLIIFSYFFVIDTLLSRLEGNFFIEDYPLLFNIGTGLFEPLLITIAIFYLWKQDEILVDVRANVANYFSSRSIFTWMCRVVVVLLLSFVIYMIIGAIAYPLTGPYMEELIKIPSMFENFSIQVLRGLAYIIVTIPVIIFWSKSNKSLLKSLIIINILTYPILGYAFTYRFPLMFRFLDGTVLTLHMTFFSYLQVKFLKKKDFDNN